jgi:hypothetical protein
VTIAKSHVEFTGGKQARMDRKSIIPAFVLASIVLFVFFRLQNYGPQSAVRRFHQAIEARDSRELQQVVDEPVESASVRTLLATVTVLLRNGPPGLLGARGSSTEERLLITYRDEIGNPFPIVFIVTKNPTDRNWKINASKTTNALKDYLNAVYGGR